MSSSYFHILGPHCLYMVAFSEVLISQNEFQGLGRGGGISSNDVVV